MPTDMKRTIAEAVLTLLIEHHVKKLTVKDIVEQCHITRQAFYYHFADIPELLRWMIDGYFEQAMDQTLALEDDEAGLRCFFVLAINAAPYVERGIQSNYGGELKRLLRQRFQRYFAMAAQRKGFHTHCPRSQLAIIQRYHCQAIMGLLEAWTEDDTRQLDEIVHTIYRIIMAEPQSWGDQP